MASTLNSQGSLNKNAKYLKKKKKRFFGFKMEGAYCCSKHDIPKSTKFDGKHVPNTP